MNTGRRDSEKHWLDEEGASDILLGVRKARGIENCRCDHLISRLAHRAFFLDDEEKQHFTMSFNGRRDHHGTMFEGRNHERNHILTCLEQSNS